jgi:hypothetical protein
MRVHVLADNSARHPAVSTMLAEQCALTSELLGRASIRERDIDAICGMNSKLEKPLVEAFREVALSR